MLRPTVLLAVAAVALTPAAADARKKPRLRPAGPDKVSAVLRDCTTDGELDRRFPLSTLRRTLRHVPTDIAEYTDCEQVIRRDIRRRR